jgi:hypothetical protein
LIHFKSRALDLQGCFWDYELKEGTGVKKPIHCDGWEALPATKILPTLFNEWAIRRFNWSFI